MKRPWTFTEKELQILSSNKGLFALLTQIGYDPKKAIRYVKYENDLNKLQEEMVRLQRWVMENDEKVVVIFEGRDAAGKGGTIRRMVEKINPRKYRVVALPKPTEDEKSQWYFQRYVNQLPKGGEMVFFDRSWYNRAVVEPVNNFCTQEQYEIFMNQVIPFEQMIVDSGTRLVKIYMSISKREQAARFKDILGNPLKIWKMTPVDERAQELWNDYTLYKEKMFDVAEQGGLPFRVIKANRKTIARIKAIKHVLASIPYDKTLEI